MNRHNCKPAKLIEPSRSGCASVAVVKDGSDILSSIVQTYLRKKAPGEADYLRFYKIQRSLSAAIEMAALAQLPRGKRFSHQRRIPGRVLQQIRDRLLEQRSRLRDCKSFQELHNMIERLALPIEGIGELAVYDTAHRLGEYLGLSPERVYLHAGTRVGARALGLDGKAKTIPMSALPKEFQVLRPDQVEDCLCIFKKELVRNAGHQAQ